MKLSLSIIILSFLLPISACNPIMIVGNTRGKVIDSQTGKPIAGAALNCEWWERYAAIVDSASSTIAEHKTTTDNEGKYDIPRFFGWGGFTGHHEGTRCFISKEGYHTYELDFSYGPYDKSRENEDNLFIQLDNINRFGQPLKWESSSFYYHRDRPAGYEKTDKKDPRLIPAPNDRLLMIKNSKETKTLISLLEDPNVYIRQAVVRRLGELKESGAIQPLINVIKDPNEYVAEAAVWSLGKYNEADTIKAIAPSLLDERTRVREMGFEMMYTSTYKGAKEVLWNTLSTNFLGYDFEALRNRYLRLYEQREGNPYK